MFPCHSTSWLIGFPWAIIIPQCKKVQTPPMVLAQTSQPERVCPKMGRNMFTPLPCLRTKPQLQSWHVLKLSQNRFKRHATNHGKLWKILGKHGNSWKNMETHGKTWTLMEHSLNSMGKFLKLMGFSWNSMGKSWKILRSTASHPEIPYDSAGEPRGISP